MISVYFYQGHVSNRILSHIVIVAPIYLNIELRLRFEPGPGSLDVNKTTRRLGLLLKGLRMLPLRYDRTDGN